MTCTWEPDSSCFSKAWDDLDSDDQERALLLATSSLQMLTNYRVGLCPITIRPCPRPNPRPCGCWNPVMWRGNWVNTACPHNPTVYPCSPVSEIILPGPVGYIDSVKVNGVELDLTSGNFRMDAGHRLVWQGAGASPFLETQDLSKPDTEPGTWSVTYSQSHQVGPDGAMAVAFLAEEFAKAFKPKGKCSLPRGVQTVARNGVSFTIEAGLYPGGLTGIDVVDAYILKWAPAGSPLRNAIVFDPSEAMVRTTAGVPRRPAATPPVI